MSRSSVFLLSPTSFPDTISLPMIAFETTAASIDLENIDILMFTSKQAVIRAYKINRNCRDIPSIAIGSATKNMITSLGGKVLFSPENYYAKELSSEISKQFSDKKILYLRPQVVMFDSKAFLKKHGIALREQIVYKTTCIEYNKSNTPPNGAIIIFTSPSTIKCFLRNFKWSGSYKAVVIGESTREYLPPKADVHVATKPLISECVKTAISLLASH